MLISTVQRLVAHKEDLILFLLMLCPSLAIAISNLYSTLCIQSLLITLACLNHVQTLSHHFVGTWYSGWSTARNWMRMKVLLATDRVFLSRPTLKDRNRKENGYARVDSSTNIHNSQYYPSVPIQTRQKLKKSSGSYSQIRILRPWCSTESTQ